MSITRKIELANIDMDVLKKALQDEYIIAMNSIILCKGKPIATIIDGQITYDTDNREHYANIMSLYLEKFMERNKCFKVTQTVNDTNAIKLIIQRR